MKIYKLTLICTVALFVTGCSSEADEGQNKPKSRMEMTAEEEGISEAEINQHSLCSKISIQMRYLNPIAKT